MNLLSIARVLMAFGLILLITGGALYLGARAGLWDRLPLGRLPGDIHIQSDNFSLSFPLATCLLLSIVLTILLNIFVRLINK
jgi:hypothetical protein